MKTADRKLAYSIVAILAVIAIEAVWFLFVGSADHSPYYATQCKSNCDIPFWASPEFWTALFTGVLTVSTVLLWRETRRLAEGADAQAAQFEKSVVAAEKAAEAAGLSAKAAIGVELPFLHFEDANFDNAFPDKAEDFDSWCGKASPVIKIRNYGRTPAFVSSIVLNGKCGVLALPPKYIPLRTVPNPFVIDGRTNLDFTEYLYKAQSDLSWEDIEKIKNGEKRFYLYVIVKFADFLGNLHSRAGIFGWSNALGKFVDYGMVHTEYDHRT